MKSFYKILIIIFPMFSCTNSFKADNHIDTYDNTTRNTLEYIENKIVKDSLLAPNNYHTLLEKQGLISVQSLDSTIKVELKYATKDNFTKEILYDDLKDAYLHPIAAEKLVIAQNLLKQVDSTLSLLIYDAVRPLSIQKKLFDVVQNTPYQAYVANPSRTGLHNYGIAVDLTICQSDGTPLDMGTKFDFFGKAAGINKENELKTQGILNEKQIENRKLLRKVMTKAGFLTIRGEWWHFNALSLSDAKAKTKLID